MQTFSVPLELKFSNAAAGEIEGYGAVFGNVDSHGDRIEPGAFTATLAKWKSGGRGLPPMYMQHGAALGADPRPVGVWTSMTEDAKGLKVAGRLIGLETETGRYNRALVAEGAIRGLSIGFRVPPDGSRPGTGEARRSLVAIDLLEVSLVDQPSNELAKVGSVKTAEQISSARDFEALLTRSGFSRSAARKLAAGGWPALKNTPDDGDLATLRRQLLDVAQNLRSA